MEGKCAVGLWDQSSLGRAGPGPGDGLVGPQSE